MHHVHPDSSLVSWDLHRQTSSLSKATSFWSQWTMMMRIFILDPISHVLCLNMEQYCFFLKKVKSMPCNLSAQYVSRSFSVLLTKTNVTNTSAGRKLYTCLNPLVQWFLSLNSACILCLKMLLLCCYYLWPDNGGNHFQLLGFLKAINSVFQKLSEQLQFGKLTFLLHSFVSTGPWILFSIKSWAFSSLAAWPSFS